MKLFNVKGEDDCINIDGKVGSTSLIVQVDDENFWANIEDGIKPLVEVLIKHKIETCSSCQGHYNSKKGELLAYVRYLNKNLLKSSAIKKATDIFNDKRIIVINDIKDSCEDERGPTEKIFFNISPQKREILNILIKKYSLFLDKYLAKKLNS